MLSGKECLISALYVCTFLTVANASKATLLLPFSTAVFQKYRIFASLQLPYSNLKHSLRSH